MADAPLDHRKWRYHVARWPIGLREKWAAFCEWYQSQGDGWLEAEHKAFDRIRAILEAKKKADPTWELVTNITTDRPLPDFGPANSLWPHQMREVVKVGRSTITEEVGVGGREARTVEVPTVGPVGAYAGERVPGKRRRGGRRRRPDPNNLIMPF